MEKAEANLGSLCLVSTTADLELQLVSHAQLASNDPYFTAEELTSKLLDDAAVVKPWVVLADTFKLVITLDIDGIDEEPHSLVQTFSQKLYDSKMWHQLSLEPTSITLSSDRIVAVQISRSDDESAATERHKYHRLSHGLPSAEVEVPSEVSTLQLNSVHLELRIDQDRESKRRKLSRLDEEWLHPKVLEPCRRLNSDELDVTEASAPMLGSQTVEPDLQRPPHDLIRPLRKRSSGSQGISSTHMICGSHQGSDSNLEQHILDLLEAGICHAIIANPKRPAHAPGIKLREVSSLYPLAEFVPSVWMSGYFTAMSSRSMFLPTISHVLSHIGIGNARSTTLRMKLAEVARRSQHPSAAGLSVPASPGSQQIKLDQLSIGLRLWGISQSALVEKSLPYQLEVLSADPEKLPAIDQHELLDVRMDYGDGGVCQEYDSDAMMELEDSGYISEENLLSLGSRFESPKIEFSQMQDEEMLLV